MLMNRTQLNSIAASGQRASGRTYAEQIVSVKGGVAAAILCPGSLPTYLHGGALNHEGAKFMSHLWISDRRSNFM